MRNAVSPDAARPRRASDFSCWLESLEARRHLSTTATPFKLANVGPRVHPSVLAVKTAGPKPSSPAPTALVTPVVQTYSGALNGKIVYTSGGHGWQWSTTLGTYTTDRGDNFEVVEDFGNQEQMSFYADYALRAGATVVPMRPVGHQLNEVVLDNDSAGVTYAGSWSNSATGARWYDEDYGAAADATRYRFASTTPGGAATATYTPNIPRAGVYPVYTWAFAGTNRTNQLYRIKHTGGQTDVRVDHRMVGNGWVYLGSYYFNAGSSATAGAVQISNDAPAGGNVIADAIRFGNGMGDYVDSPAPGPSGHPREEENAYAWLTRGIGLGITPSSVLGSDNVSAPSNMALHMNQNANPFGTSVYIGFHSNAGGGAGRGAVGLIDTDVAERTPNQEELALFTGRQINQDMQSLNGQFEHNWSTRTAHTYTDEFGEINLGTSAEMDATIIEVAFHDNQMDAELMRDPKVRMQLAKSTLDATLEYFDFVDTTTVATSAPSAPVSPRATVSATGDVTLNWSAGPTGARGGAATGYRVYVSRDGKGFGKYLDVAGGGSTTLVIPAADLDGNAYYFRVAATNAGGESPMSYLVGARKYGSGGGGGGTNRVLIVNGFDRFDRTGNVRYRYLPAPDDLTDRVRPPFNNGFDYVAQAAEAIEAYRAGDGVAVGFDTAQNEHVASGAVNLANYRAVIWLAGEESTEDESFNGTEQTRVANYLAGGGRLFVSGAEVGWDLDRNAGESTPDPTSSDRTFYETVLRSNYVGDDAGTYTITAGGSVPATSIFAGLANFAFDNGAEFYNAEFPDRLGAVNGSSVALNYSGGLGGAAALQWKDAVSGARLVNFGFPFETITTAANRAGVMSRVLDYFGLFPATIGGQVYRDDDSSGSRNTGEAGLNGWTVYLDLDNDGTLDVTEPSTVTAGDGDYAFAGLAPDTYNVRTVLQADHVRTSPTGASAITVIAGQAVTTNFGNFHTVLAGTGGNDAFYVQGVPPSGHLNIWTSGAPGVNAPNFRVSRTALPSLRFETGDGDDALVLDFVNGHTFLTAAGSLMTFDGGAGADQLMIRGGSGGESLLANAAGRIADTFVGAVRGPVQYVNAESVQFDGNGGNDALTFATPPVPVSFNGGTGADTLNVTGGTYAFATDAAVTSDALTVNVSGATASAVFDATQHLAALNLTTGARARFGTGGGRVLATSGLSIDGTSQLDLGNNDLIWRSTGATKSGNLATLNGWIRSAINAEGSLWAGMGLTSSAAKDDAQGITALGVLLNDDTQVGGTGDAVYTSFAGETSTADDILVKYTYFGDADLNGEVDGTDYALADNGSVNGLIHWLNGDFDYSGDVDGTDYALLDNAFVNQGDPIA